MRQKTATSISIPVAMLTAITNLAIANRRSFSAQLVSMLELHPDLAPLRHAEQARLRALLAEKEREFESPAIDSPQQKWPG